MYGKSEPEVKDTWYDYLKTTKGAQVKPEKDIKTIIYDMTLACTYPKFNNGKDCTFLTKEGAKYVVQSIGKSDLDTRRPQFLALIEEHTKPKPPAPKRPRFYSTDSLDVSTLVSGMQRQVVRRIDNGLTSVRTEVQSVGTAVTHAVGFLQTNVNTNHSDMVAKMEQLQRTNADLNARLAYEQTAHKATSANLSARLADEQKAHKATSANLSARLADEQKALNGQKETTDKKQASININMTTIKNKDKEIEKLKKQIDDGTNSGLSMQIRELDANMKVHTANLAKMNDALKIFLKKVLEQNTQILDAVRDPRSPV